MGTRPARQGRRPTQERAKATREHILDTAARLFGERGIADTSTNRIAAEADVSIGTVYRYFADRTVMVDELLERLLIRAEQRCTAWISETTMHSGGITRASATDLFTRFLENFTEELVDNAKLVRALIDGVQFYNSGLPEFEPRLRLLIKVMLIQILGPGNDRKYDTMTYVLINTGFSAVLRTTAVEVTPEERAAAIAMTGRMMGAWLEHEMDLV